MNNKNEMKMGWKRIENRVWFQSERKTKNKRTVTKTAADANALFPIEFELNNASEHFFYFRHFIEPPFHFACFGCFINLNSLRTNFISFHIFRVDSGNLLV